jgi:hypothetical protein
MHAVPDVCGGEDRLSDLAIDLAGDVAATDQT